MLGASYYPPDEPISHSRPLDDKRFTVDHLYVKLFKLPALMNTAPAKAEAERRASFMEAFVDELRLEIAGTLR